MQPASHCTFSLVRSLGVLVVATGLSGAPGAAEPPPTGQELQQLDQAIQRIESWLAEAQQQRPELEHQLQTAESRLAEIRQQIAATRLALAEGNRRLLALQDQEVRLTASRNEQLEQVRQLLRAAYKSGSQGTLKLVLNQEDPAVAVRMLHYFRRINAFRLARVEEYQQTLTSLQATHEALENSRNTLLNHQQQLDEQLAQQEQFTNARQQALLALDTAMRDRRSELDGLVADREALQALIDEVQRAVEDIPVPGSALPFSQRRGDLPWPVSGPLLAKFGDSYGNGDLQRQGITISGTAGDPVRAVHGGRVVFADWLRGTGLLLILDHGDGYMSLYGHNETLTRERGSWVDAGSVIATVGNSGGQRITGSYFEIRHNGRPQDPMPWLQPPE